MATENKLRHHLCFLENAPVSFAQDLNVSYGVLPFHPLSRPSSGSFNTLTSYFNVCHLQYPDYLWSLFIVYLLMMVNSCASLLLRMSSGCFCCMPEMGNGSRKPRRGSPCSTPGEGLLQSSMERQKGWGFFFVFHCSPSRALRGSGLEPVSSVLKDCPITISKSRRCHKGCLAVCLNDRTWYSS